MTKPLQNSATWSDTLRTREHHLNALLKSIESRPGKSRQIQALTMNAIKAEIALIESQLSRRK